MAFQDITLQSVQHDSGAVVGTFDRYAILSKLGERIWYIDIERTTDGGWLSIPSLPRWDSGEFLTADEVSTAIQVIQEAFAYWNRVAYIDHYQPGVKSAIERPDFRARMKPEELARAFPLE